MLLYCSWVQRVSGGAKARRLRGGQDRADGRDDLRRLLHPVAWKGRGGTRHHSAARFVAVRGLDRDVSAAFVASHNDSRRPSRAATPPPRRGKGPNRRHGSKRRDTSQRHRSPDVSPRGTAASTEIGPRPQFAYRWPDPEARSGGRLRGPAGRLRRKRQHRNAEAAQCLLDRGTVGSYYAVQQASQI
jgi:hypothetical protein